MQYLTLDESVYTGERPETGIMQPPLREDDEKILLWKQVADGIISTIGTDHCDYTISQKREHTEFTKTPGGIPGLETLLPLLATEGVAAGRISWSRLVEVCCANPARIFGLGDKGRLEPGADADVVIYDPRVEGTISGGEAAQPGRIHPVRRPARAGRGARRLQPRAAARARGRVHPRAGVGTVRELELEAGSWKRHSSDEVWALPLE